MDRTGVVVIEVMASIIDDGNSLSGLSVNFEARTEIIRLWGSKYGGGLVD